MTPHHRANCSQIRWYTLGLRLSQTEVALQFIDTVGVSDPPLQFARCHLAAVVEDTIFRHPGYGGTHEDRTLFLSLNSSGDETTIQDAFSLFASRVDAIAGRLSEPDRSWFQLGRAIARTEDELVSEGRPHIVSPGEIDPETTASNRDSLYGRLEFIGSVPGDWFRNPTESVDRLLRQLDLQREQVFPMNLDEESDEGNLQGISQLPLSLWGWRNLEVGLIRMQSDLVCEVAARPNWNATTRVLSFAGHEIRTYKRRARNQFSVLDAFEAEMWPSSIRSPFGCPKQTADVIKDLNRGLRGNRVRFNSGGPSRIGWIRFPGESEDVE